MRYIIAAIAVVGAIVFAGCGGSGGTTTVVTQEPTTTRAQDEQTLRSEISAGDLTDTQESLIDSVVAKNPEDAAQICRYNDSEGAAARNAFAKGFGTNGGVSGYEFFDYVVGNYC